MTVTERQRKHQAAKRERGLVPLTIWTPAAAAADFKRASELIQSDPDLRIGRMVSEKTGRVRGLNS